MKTLRYKINAPTVLDFLKIYMADILGIELVNQTETKKREIQALNAHEKIEAREKAKEEDR